MKRSSGARLCATATLGALSLALLTGCSDEGADSKDDAKSGGSGGSPSSPVATATARTAAELEKLLLAQGEVKGYRVTSGDDTLPKSKSDVKTDKAECAPLAYAMSGLAPGETEANASNTVTEDKASDAASKNPKDLSEEDIAGAFKVDMTFVGLSSYDGDRAVRALNSVSDGVKACSGGFGITSQGEKQKITKVAEGKASGAGDESVAFSVSSDMDGQGTATFNTEVVRVGNTVATYYTVNFGNLETGKAAEIPSAVIEGQAAKLK
ncbi:hypothetical protein [Streptomyces griseus]|uniref:hypothetical protein n=1 Tax=Streptomyces griseus TaxID=1911 RepID=UPI00055FED03|nr:hypothetical protein [Streptomyces griseus]